MGDTSLFFVAIIMVFLAFGLSNCKPSKSTQTSVEKVEVNVPKPIVVDLKGRVDPSVVISGLQKYELKLVKSINKEANQWVFMYNPDVVSADEMLKILKYEQWMEDAWFYVE